MKTWTRMLKGHPGGTWRAHIWAHAGCISTRGSDRHQDWSVWEFLSISLSGAPGHRLCCHHFGTQDAA